MWFPVKWFFWCSETLKTMSMTKCHLNSPEWGTNRFCDHLLNNCNCSWMSWHVYFCGEITMKHTRAACFMCSNKWFSKLVFYFFFNFLRWHLIILNVSVYLQNAHNSGGISYCSQSSSPFKSSRDRFSLALMQWWGKREKGVRSLPVCTLVEEQSTWKIVRKRQALLPGHSDQGNSWLWRGY